ncbi:MAG: UPF0280 family protein [Desulfobacterota bacterium]|nr:UPF0280 family protein [Thermodesulfobacteriota bacterium]
MYFERTYRDFEQNQRFHPFQVVIKETDLYIKAGLNLQKESLELARFYRKQIEDYINLHPYFQKSLVPLPFDPDAPSIIKEMLAASSQTGVGPMAAVAGAIAEFVGKSLLRYSSEVIVENGGDIFAVTSKSFVVEIFAGCSPFSQKIGVEFSPHETPIGVCTSSGTVGPSLSFGKADAVTVISSSAILADAAATAIGNLIKHKKDISQGLKFGSALLGIKGILIVMDEKLGVWGGIKLVNL